MEILNCKYIGSRQLFLLCATYNPHQVLLMVVMGKDAF